MKRPHLLGRLKSEVFKPVGLKVDRNHPVGSSLV